MDITQPDRASRSRRRFSSYLFLFASVFNDAVVKTRRDRFEPVRRRGPFSYCLTANRFSAVCATGTRRELCRMNNVRKCTGRRISCRVTISRSDTYLCCFCSTTDRLENAVWRTRGASSTRGARSNRVRRDRLLVSEIDFLLLSTRLTFRCDPGRENSGRTRFQKPSACFRRRRFTQVVGKTTTVQKRWARPSPS